jgi:hypothetical protein
LDELWNPSCFAVQVKGNPFAEQVPCQLSSRGRSAPNIARQILEKRTCALPGIALSSMLDKEHLPERKGAK